MGYKIVARFPVALAVPPEAEPRIPECAGYAVGIVAHPLDETGCNWDIYR